MKKILTFLCAVLMSVGMWAEPITVTWDNSDLPLNGMSFTKDGVTLTCGSIENKDFLDNGTFATDLGNFTKIEVTAYAGCFFNGTGWSDDFDQKTWTGNAAIISFDGEITNITKIVFTIEPRCSGLGKAG